MERRKFFRSLFGVSAAAGTATGLAKPELFVVPHVFSGVDCGQCGQLLLAHGYGFRPENLFFMCETDGCPSAGVPVQLPRVAAVLADPDFVRGTLEVERLQKAETEDLLARYEAERTQAEALTRRTVTLGPEWRA